jgi:nicotinamidase-related amidase
MNPVARRSSFNRILVDMNTQCDFLLPRGAMPVANRREILPNIRRLMNWARVERLPVISTLEAHRPGEPTRGLPAHCIDQTNGQKKLPFTLLPRRVLLYGDNTMDLPHEPFRRFQQLIFTKRDRDFLSNPKADRLIQSLDANHLILFGVVAEFCIKAAALGLLTRRHRVVVVADACGHWSRADQELSYRQMDAKGAILVTTEELLSGAADDRILNAARPTPAVEEEPVVLVPADSKGHPANGNGNGKSHHEPEILPVLDHPAPCARRRTPATPADESSVITPSLLGSPARPPARQRRAPQDLA